MCILSTLWCTRKNIRIMEMGDMKLETLALNKTLNILETLLLDL